MENMKIKTVITVVTLILNNAQCTLVTRPSNAAKRIGDFVIMRCSSSSSYVDEACGGIAWKYFQTKSSSGTYINSKDVLIPSVRSHISIYNSSAGNCDLKISATELAGGMYECVDSTPDEAAAELTTLDHKVNEMFRDNITTDLQCFVRYYGNWLPKVQWMKTFKDGWTNADSTDNEASKNHVSINITIFGAPEQFVCKVTVFEPGKPNAYDWMSRAYSWKNSTKENPCAEDPVQNDGISVGVVIVLSLLIIVLVILCLCLIFYIIFRRIQRKPNKREENSQPVEELIAK